MSAGTWKCFKRAKHYLGDGTINLSSGVFYVKLATSASNVKSAGSAAGLSTISSITNAVASNGDYSTAGQTLSGMTWGTAAASAGAQMWNANDSIWTASSSAIANWKFAVIYQSGGKLWCYCTLTSSQQTLSIGSSLTIQYATTGILNLS